jgi:hypothetical protein
MLVGLVLVSGALLAARLMAERRREATVALAVAALVGAGELASTIPARYFVNASGPATSAGPTSTGDGSGVLGFLRAHTGRQDRVAADVPNLPPPWAGFPPVWHLSDVNGFQPQFSKYQLSAVRAESPGTQTSNREFTIVPGLGAYLDEMGVRYVVVSAGQDPFVHARGWVPVFRDVTYHAYLAARLARRAFAIDPRCLRQRGAGQLRSCRTALAVVTAAPSESLRRFALQRSPTHTLLITGEPWYPGWQATDSAGSLPVRRIGFLAAVSVPAGVTELTLDYQPPGLILGALVSVLAIGGSLVVLGLRVAGSTASRRHRGRRSGNRAAWRRARRAGDS